MGEHRKADESVKEAAARIREALRDEQRVSAALKRATRDAIQRHRAAGVPMAVWRDGKVILITAEEMESLLTADDASNGHDS